MLNTWILKGKLSVICLGKGAFVSTDTQWGFETAVVNSVLPDETVISTQKVYFCVHYSKVLHTT